MSINYLLPSIKYKNNYCFRLSKFYFRNTYRNWLIRGQGSVYRTGAISFIWAIKSFEQSNRSSASFTCGLVRVAHVPNCMDFDWMKKMTVSVYWLAFHNLFSLEMLCINSYQLPKIQCCFFFFFFFLMMTWINSTNLLNSSYKYMFNKASLRRYCTPYCNL